MFVVDFKAIHTKTGDVNLWGSLGAWMGRMMRYFSLEHGGRLTDLRYHQLLCSLLPAMELSRKLGLKSQESTLWDSAHYLLEACLLTSIHLFLSKLTPVRAAMGSGDNLLHFLQLGDLIPPTCSLSALQESVQEHCNTASDQLTSLSIGHSQADCGYGGIKDIAVKL